MVEKKEKRGKLTVAAFSMQVVSGEWWWRDSISLVNRGLGGTETHDQIHIVVKLWWWH